METGKFITFEGIEGVGKSTNIAHMVRILEERGQSVVTTREPGGTPMAEQIRGLVAEHGDEAMPDIAELLLVFAARALHVNNVIRPALAAGSWVICDRFTDSSRVVHIDTPEVDWSPGLFRYLDRCLQCHAGRMAYRENAATQGLNYHQYAAAPLSAHAAEVQRPSTASGIASVAKMIPNARKASTSMRSVSFLRW